MQGNSLALAHDFHCHVSHPNTQHHSPQGVGERCTALPDLDEVVDVRSHIAPLGVDVGRCWHRLRWHRLRWLSERPWKGRWFNLGPFLEEQILMVYRMEPERPKFLVSENLHDSRKFCRLACAFPG